MRRENLRWRNINLRQAIMNIQEHCLKFTILSKYGPSLVSNLKDGMNRYVNGLFNLVEEEFRTTMIDDEMNISRLTVFTKQI